MNARVILSFDCEGKWGIADCLTPSLHAQHRDARLREVYTRILALLDKYHIPATFAFVGCFSASPEKLALMRPDLEKLAVHFPHYLGRALEDCFDGTREGWTGDWAVEAVQNAQCDHEVGLHGVTHIPWDDPAMTEELACEELDIAYRHTLPLVANCLTQIFPRNAVAFTHLLAERGILGYREARRPSSRFASLLSEFNIWAVPDAAFAYESPQRIPAGYFLNWHHGLRKLVPVTVTRLRVRNLLRRAARDQMIVHYWTHPENFATAPSTFAAFEALLQEVAIARDAGLCTVLTQASYTMEEDSHSRRSR